MVVKHGGLTRTKRPVEPPTSSATADTSSDSESSLERPSKPKKPRKNCCSVILGFFYKIYRSEPSQYRTLKMFFGYPFGGMLGLGLYHSVIKPMELADDTRHLLGGMMMLGLAIGYSSYVSARCVSLLLIPTFFGKAGRSYIGTFAIAYLISGPMMNMMDNAQDITRSLTCAATLAANHTAAKWELRLKPIHNLLSDMKNDGFMLNKVGKKVNKVFSPVKEEVRSDENIDVMKAKHDRKYYKKKKGKINKQSSPAGVENKYKGKIKQRCKDIYAKGTEKCRNTFNGIYHRCMDKLPGIINDVICPLCRAHWLCEIAKLIGKAVGVECEPDKFLPAGFGQAYVNSEKSVEQMDSNMEIGLRYKVVKQKEDIDYTNVEMMRSNAMHDFKNGRTYVEFFMVLVKRVLAFTFLLVIFKAYKYYKSFTSDVRFDNVYITPYFRKVDARRRAKGKKTLLPLKKIEAGQYIVITSPSMMKSERKKFGKGTVLLVIRCVCAWMIFFADNILYTVMDVIRKHSKVDYKQTGFNHINVTIVGTGFMSNIVRLFIKGLDTKHELKQLTSNLECLPNPVEMDKKYYSYVYGVYAVIWVLILVDAYALRLRKEVAAFFFRKREKQRVLHLYNTMMKSRKMYLRNTIRKMKKKARKLKLGSRSGLLHALTKSLPWLCGWLRVFTSARGRCLVCDDVENKNFKSCKDKHCTFIYCPDCWIDLKDKCYACMPLDDFSTTDTDDTSDDGDADDV